jgi:hypothetical protein
MQNRKEKHNFWRFRVQKTTYLRQYGHFEHAAKILFRFLNLILSYLSGIDPCGRSSHRAPSSP